MKLSIITTVTNPNEREDPWYESLKCYQDLADEVIVVDGGKRMNDDFLIASFPKCRWVYLDWPQEWSWEELPKHLNLGFELATGDWVIKVDIDQIFHEKDFAEIRKRLENLPAIVATFQKFSVYPHKRYTQKGEVTIAINKNMLSKLPHENIKFGQPIGRDSDLCSPVRAIRQNDRGVWEGEAIPLSEIGRTGQAIWNFDYTFKTREIAVKEFFRFSRAHKRYFSTSKWGDTEQEAEQKFFELMRDRFIQSEYRITDLDILPKYIRRKYRDLTVEQFGHSGWGKL